MIQTSYFRFIERNSQSIKLSREDIIKHMIPIFVKNQTNDKNY
jgi:hypothetical protein